MSAVSYASRERRGVMANEVASLTVYHKCSRYIDLVTNRSTRLDETCVEATRRHLLWLVWREHGALRPRRASTQTSTIQSDSSSPVCSQQGLGASMLTPADDMATAQALLQKNAAGVRSKRGGSFAGSLPRGWSRSSRTGLEADPTGRLARINRSMTAFRRGAVLARA
jgi:hypothetical protein